MTKLTKNPTLKDYQAFIREICVENGWDNRTPVELMLLLTEEVGELAKAIRKETGSFGYSKPDNTEHLEEELTDVFNYLLDVANQYNIDLETAFREKWQKNTTRSWEGSYGKKTQQTD